ncbi:DEAD/DEAH box helicase [Granulicella cerasi]|uniref:DEAD/DEAH box helicase n=1 Tax=Granulicella cerasi TaxID=741063 RepID=A0ABW1Z8P0_9BACT|nr:DEAD/DEAH box helicase [Granulicella cerasi]
MSTLTLDSILNPKPLEVARTITQDQASAVVFNDFKLSDSLKKRLADANYVTPTPVQAGAIPPALEGEDILATASTGTGKTLSFLVPMIERLEDISKPSTKSHKEPILALILLPTRELAMQVLENFHKLCPTTKNDSVLVVGGLSENGQLDELKRGPRVVVATPGRLEDFLRRKAIRLDEVDMLVLDEVDRMLDMGFLPAIRRIVGALPKDRQTMCYSATLDANIREIVKEYVTKPVRVEIGNTSKPSDRVELRAYIVMQDQKLSQLDKMLAEEEGTFIVFARTKHGSDRVARKLEKLGHSAEVIHGDRSQAQRSQALKRFADGRARILVATDVAARGIDISHIAHVVNYDLPNGSDDFVHRIGRTGRAGAKGVATTFVTPLEKGDGRKLERELKIQFQWREADKNLAKEERNAPLDLASADLLSLETRSWKSESGESAPAPHAQHRGPKSSKGPHSGGGRPHAGHSRGGRPGAGSANGSSRSGNGGGRPGGNRRRRS